MPAIAHSGRARISVRHPQGLGECDRCGFWRNLVALKQQFQWGGYSLQNTGLLVCSDCLDKPQEQLRTPNLPPDPRPLVPSRPSANVTPIPIIGQPLPTTPANLGFTQLYIGAASLPGKYPADTPGDVLANVLAQTGISLPPGVYFQTSTMNQNAGVILWPQGFGRSFMLLYNPAFVPVQLSLDVSATPGAITNLSIGPNEAFLSATALGLGPAYTGAVTALSQYGGFLPFWSWANH